MIEVKALSRIAFEKTLDTPGGFAWWYADLSTAEGEGLVLVWSLGLPFLPGSREAPLPRSRPSVHFASYGGGGSDVYVLKELGPMDVHEIDMSGNCRWGDSTITVRSLPEAPGEPPRTELRALLEFPVAHSDHALAVDFELSGASVSLPDSQATDDHVWTPRAVAAHGRATIRYAGRVRTLQGPAYFDGNCSRSALHEQGIASWRWGRISFEDRSVIYYETSGSNSERDDRSSASDRRGRVLVQWRDGRVELEDLPLHFSRPRRGNFGLTTTRQVDFRCGGNLYSLHLRDLVDDGPFYQRFWMEGDCRTTSGHKLRGSGIAEYVVPPRVDQPWQRPFVKMKTEQARAKNSPFLPLFSGPSEDRADRLARSLVGGLFR